MVKTKTFGWFIITCFFLTACNGLKTNQAKEGPPNIIFILADDMSYRDLSCYGQKRYETPNLDALAATGIRFNQAYAAAPECAPSRGCLMTGLHTGHGPIRMNSSARGQDHLYPEDQTIAEHLKTVGYRTGFAGKWGIGLPGTPGVPYQQGFDYSFGYYDQGRAHTFIPYYLWENDQRIFYPENDGFDMKRRYDYRGNKAQNTYDDQGKLYIEELADPYSYTYSQNAIEAATFKFLDQNNPTQTGDPFFLYFAPQLPHGPVIVDDLGPMIGPDSVEQVTREWAAMVLQLDHFVGDLVTKLKAEGLYDNTIIFFASDNGYSMCGYTERGNGPDWPDDPWLENKGPFKGGKFSVLEGGIRVPFFVSWPAKYQAAVYEEPVWLPDFFPTALDLAGHPPLDYAIDGQSLVPLLEGRPQDFQSHEYLYFSKGPEQAVRMGPWKAYRKSPQEKLELYRIIKDSYMEENVAEAQPQVVAQMEAIMSKSHEPHEWYRNPNENREDFQEKRAKAVETGNIMPRFKPNSREEVPWEK